MNNIVIDPVAIGQRLRVLRGNKPLEQVAKDTGISRSALNMYELGERMPRDIKKIILAEYFGKSVEEIFFSDT